jgi:hypothetical protein
MYSINPKIIKSSNRINLMPVFTKLDDYKREPIVNFMYRLQALLLLILASSLLSAKQSERYYQTQYADKIGGRTEVVMKDGTRCDIVTSTHAIEVDFAKKWAEDYWAEP